MVFTYSSEIVKYLVDLVDEHYFMKIIFFFTKISINNAIVLIPVNYIYTKKDIKQMVYPGLSGFLNK